MTLADSIRVEPVTLIQGHVLDVLRRLPDGCVHCVVTSPPYWGLRDYGTAPLVWGGDPACTHEWGTKLPARPGRGNKPGDLSTSGLTNPVRQDEVPRAADRGQLCSRCNAWRGSLGLEPTPAFYVEHMVAVFHEVRRTMHHDATLFLNVGDSYSAAAYGRIRADEKDHFFGLPLAVRRQVFCLWRRALGSSVQGDVRDLLSAQGRRAEGVREARGVGGGVEAGDSGGTVAREVPSAVLELQRRAWSLWSVPSLELDISDVPREAHGLFTVTIKPKDLIGIPWRLAFALQRDGWWLRSDIIWAKGVSGQRELAGQVATACAASGVSAEQTEQIAAMVNPYVGRCMPESVTDRPTRAHEYLFLLAKRVRYFYDVEAVKVPAIHAGRTLAYDGKQKNCHAGDGVNTRRTLIARNATVAANRNLRSVWTIGPEPLKAAHFAAFPTALVKPCVQAGTSEHGVCATCGAPWKRIVERTGKVGMGGGCRKHTEVMDRAGSTSAFVTAEYNVTRTAGWRPTCACPPAEPIPAIVLDPFCGSGRAGVAAVRLGRHFVGIELKAEYIKLAAEQIGAAL